MFGGMGVNLSVALYYYIYYYVQFMRKGIFRLIEKKTNDIDSMIVIIKQHYEFIFLFVLNNTVSWKVFTILEIQTRTMRFFY